MIDCEAMWIRDVRDNRRTGVVVVFVIVKIVELDGGCYEGVVVVFIVHAEEGSGAEGVDEDGAAAFDGVAHAVEELEAWWGVVVHQVHVQAEVEGGVARVSLGERERGKVRDVFGLGD